MIVKKKFFNFLLITIIIFIIYLPGFVRIQRLYNHKKELEKEIKVLKNENRELKQEIHKLQYDTTYIEKVAREELKLGKDGEIIYKIPSEKK
ncbi:MAG: septum formation initiator family protein [Candidatus Omnitrophica bacterium]|nr:septum formation initiator family protein [Candidatus Omnitrophota bacterium]